jgi:8-oxo-dGTP pyrophosphatase MutT (NUDIX family)
MKDPAETLTRAERGEDLPGRGRTGRPRDAATLVLVDRSGGTPRVLMGRRHQRHAFMPGRFVFPGGRIDPADTRVVAAAALDPLTERRLLQRMQRPTPSRARALAFAAIRETFEETGVLLGRKIEGALQSALPAWQPFAERGLGPDLSALRFVFRAVTPPKRPRRFDTRFFLADRSAVAGEIGGAVGPDREFVELKWLTLAETEHEDLPTVTRVVLVESMARLAGDPAADPPVPFYYWKRGRFHREEIG